MSTQAYGEARRPGWLTFAAVVMFSVGFLRVIAAIYYFAHSVRVNNVANGAFGHHYFVWGLWDLLIAAVAFYAGYSLLEGGTFGRVAAYIWAGLVIVESFLMLGVAPWWGFAGIILASFVIYAVAVTPDYGAPDM